MKEFLIKIKTGTEKDLTIGSFSGLTWGESLDEEENDRKTFTFNVSSQNSDLLEYIKVGRIIRLESENPSFKKSFVISSIGPVEGETENEDFFEVVAEDFASFIFSRNNVGMTLDTMVDDDYIEWLDSVGADGNAEDLVNYILVRGRLKSTDNSDEDSWKIGKEIKRDLEGIEIGEYSDLSEYRVNLQLSDSNTYNALIEVALLTDTIMEFDYEEKTISFYNRAENKKFDKGFQLSPYFNLADLNMTLTGETLFPILHMEGGEADTGMVVSAIPYLSYSSWERLHKRLKAKFEKLDEIEDSEEREAAVKKIVDKMKSGTFFEEEYAKRGAEEDPDDLGVLLGVTITEEQVEHIDSIPYLDSFLLSLDYYQDFIEESEEGAFQSFLEMIYLDLGVANSNLQSKNIRNMLIEEQILRTERRINEAAETVAASREDIYEDESNKLDSLFMEKGGRQSEEKNYINWIQGDTVIPGTGGKQFRDFYTGRYVFQEIDYDEYQHLKALKVSEESEEKVYKDWDEKSELTGEENPNLLYRAKTSSEETEYYFTNEVKKLRGLKINIDEEDKNGSTRIHEVEFSDSSEADAGMSDKILRMDDEIDNSKWEKWDKDGYRQYSDKRYTVELAETESNFEDWEDFFDDKVEGKNKIEIEPKGKLMFPELKAVNSSLESSTKPVRSSEWEFADDSMTGYTKIEMKNDFYRNLSGTELYSGSTNPNMSYPVKIPNGFYNDFHEDAQFYPLNDNVTLVVEQNKRIGYVTKDDPKNFVGIKGNANDNIEDDQIYRVFFYSDSEFSISWGSQYNSWIGLYTVNSDDVDRSEAAVWLNSPIGTVTGGWYREKELLDENITVEIVDNAATSPFREQDLKIGNLGLRYVFGDEFSEEYLREDVTNNLTYNRIAIDDDFQDVLDDAMIGKEYVITGATVWGSAPNRTTSYYKITLTFTLKPESEKEKGFYFMNKTTKKIEASTKWLSPIPNRKAWQFANIIFRGYRPTMESTPQGYDQILTHGDTYLFITLDAIMSPVDQWTGWSATGSGYNPIERSISSQDKLYLLQAYDSNTSSSGNIYFLEKDSNSKTYITGVTGDFNKSTITSPEKDMIWLGGSLFLAISSRGNIWVGTYWLVTGTSSKQIDKTESKVEFPKILQMEPEWLGMEQRYKWDYLPFENIIFYKGKLGTSWGIDLGHTINLGDERIDQDEVERQVSHEEIHLPLDAISYHWDEDDEIYNARQISWGARALDDIPSSEIVFKFKVAQARIEHTKNSFDMLRFETPYLDLLNVFRGQDYIRDLNYKYRREIDFYINERKEVEEKIAEAEGEEKEFYNSELEAIESEIGDASGYILPDKLEGLGDFWKYRTLSEYKNETGVDSIQKWKNYSAWLTDSDLIRFEDIELDDLIVIEFRATGIFSVNGDFFDDPTGFWEKRIFISEKSFLTVQGENIQIRSIKVVDPKNADFIKTLNNLIIWENEFIYDEDNELIYDEDNEPVAITPPDGSEEGEGVTIDHMRVFLTQPEKYTDALKEIETEMLGYSTIKGRLTLKQNRFEHFMWDRESRATKASPITYEKSTHGELKDAREKREKIWFDLKKDYPEFLLEGYYTNETENDAYNLLKQAKANYKYHNKPSEEYSITYIKAQDLVGDANDVKVGDKVAIKSRMRDQLELSDRLQVTAISRELRDPGNIQIEVSPIRRDNLLEKVFGLIKRK